MATRRPVINTSSTLFSHGVLLGKQLALLAELNPRLLANYAFLIAAHWCVRSCSLLVRAAVCRWWPQEIPAFLILAHGTSTGRFPTNRRFTAACINMATTEQTSHVV